MIGFAKKALKDSYQSWKHHQQTRHLQERLSAKQFKEAGSHVFFGYYDLNPFDAQNRRVLAHRVNDLAVVSPSVRDLVDIGYFEMDGERGFRKIGESHTWCWQLGARLRWMPGTEEKAIAYNDFLNDNLVTVIKPLAGKDRRVLDAPLYDISSDGQIGLSLNFHRLQRLRPGYGYAADRDHTADQLCPEQDGIFRIDIGDNRKELFISTAKVSKIHPHPSMVEANHYLNHISFNKTGTKFIFYHLWVDTKGKRYTRVLLADTGGSAVKVLYNGPKVSHYSWLDDQKLVFLIKFTENWNYCIFNTETGLSTILESEKLQEDGHPSFAKDQRFMVTDTYPIYGNYQKLILYELKANRGFDLKSYYSPPLFRKEFKCDLHPRFSTDNRCLCIDTVSEGQRIMEVLYLDRLWPQFEKTLK